jgi:hypothetical protein
MRVVLASAPSLAASLCLLAGAALSGVAEAQSSGGGKSIYTCVDPSGKRRTSDRPIPECNDREQRELNSDGSLRRVVPPTMTQDERAAAEARDQQAALAAANQREAIRRDRNLLMRFPNEAAHTKAREAALDGTRKSLQLSESRLALLQKERKPLLDESEFYVGKQLPAKLKQQLDGNDAATEAQRSLVLNQQAELVRINDLYDVELERLRKLWSGATPGSMGVLPKVEPAASAPRRPAL